MKVSRTTDYDLVASLMKHPRVFPWLGDDGSPSAEEYSPAPSDSIYYLLVENDGPVGVFVFIPQGAATGEIHTCLTPKCWGRKALEATGLCMRWIFDHTEFVRIITSVPSDNPLAMRLAVNSGLVQYGVNPKSFLRGGELLDLHLFGISKD